MEALVRLTDTGLDRTELHWKESYDSLRNKENELQNIKGFTKKTSCRASRHQLNYYAAAVAMTPNCSTNSAESSYALVAHSILSQLGLNPEAEQSVQISPSANTITGALANLAASCIVSRLKSVAKAKFIFGTFDKGHRAGVSHFAKIISFYNRDLMRTELFKLDIDPAGNSNVDAAEAVKKSMTGKELLPEKKLSGQATDNGGGGTLESFAEMLRNLEVTNPLFYFIVNCVLHNLSLALSVPVEAVFGLGGHDKSNGLQLMHSIFDLAKYYSQEVWVDLIIDAMEYLRGVGKLPIELEDGEPPNKMPQPVTTRWWWLGVSSGSTHKWWVVYHYIGKNTVNAVPAKSYANIVGSSIDALMKEELFYGHIIFLKCYTVFLINPHFNFLQEKGTQSKVAGFRCDAILVVVFFLHQDFNAVRNNGWSNHPKFELFNNHLNDPRWISCEEEQSKEEQEESTKHRVEQFIAIAKQVKRMRTVLQKQMEKETEVKNKIKKLMT